MRFGLIPLSCIGATLALGSVGLGGSGEAVKFGGIESYRIGSFTNAVAIGDLNGDRKPDLAVASDNLTVLLNRGKGRFRAAGVYRTATAPYGVAIGDLNGDGKRDVVTANYTGSVSAFLNRGGKLAQRVDYPTGSGPWSVAIGDLNGDGAPDLAVGNTDPDTVSVLLNRGNGTFRAKTDYATGSGPISVAIADLNGDGRPDVVAANVLADTVSVLLNEGDAALAPKVDYATGPGPYSLAIHDVNGDGKPDLATANYGDVTAGGGGTTASVLLNRGDGTFKPKVSFDTEWDPVAVALSDVSGDGKPDLVVAGDSYQPISVRVGRGDGSFELPLRCCSYSSPTSMAVGDVNGDRRPDLVTTNEDDRVLVLINATGLCRVPLVVEGELAVAKHAIVRSECTVGRIRRAYSAHVRKGRVISESPRRDSVLPHGAKVSLVVSRGRAP